jgi:hypothetical protein
MKDELMAVLSKVGMTKLALESLRANDTARALELLELDLDASVVRLARLAKEVGPDERERATDFLQLVCAYRRDHPRRTEADLGSLASGLLVRAAREGGERARQILEEMEQGVS